MKAFVRLLLSLMLFISMLFIGNNERIVSAIEVVEYQSHYQYTRGTDIPYSGGNASYITETMYYTGLEQPLFKALESFSAQLIYDSEKIDTYYAEVNNDETMNEIIKKAYDEAVPYVFIKHPKRVAMNNVISRLEHASRGDSFAGITYFSYLIDNNYYTTALFSYGDKLNYRDAEEEFIRLATNYINSNFTTDLEKLVATYKLTLEHIEYDYDSLTALGDNGFNQYMSTAVVNKEAVCAGYSKFFRKIIEALGFEAYNVSGYATGTSEDLHMWTVVEFENRYYAVDTTFGDTGGRTDADRVKYLLFDESAYDYRLRLDESLYFPFANNSYDNRMELLNLYHKISVPEFQVGLSMANDYTISEELWNAISSNSHEYISTKDWFAGKVNYKAENIKEEIEEPIVETPAESENLAVFTTKLQNLSIKSNEVDILEVISLYKDLSTGEKESLSTELMKQYQYYEGLYEQMVAFSNSILDYVIIPQTDAVTEDFLGWSINLTGTLSSTNTEGIHLYDKWGNEILTVINVSDSKKAIEVYLPADITYEKGMEYTIKIDVHGIQKTIYKFKID